MWPPTREDELRQRLRRRGAFLIGGLFGLFVGGLIAILNFFMILGGQPVTILALPLLIVGIALAQLWAYRRIPTAPRADLLPFEELPADDPRQRLSCRSRRSIWLRAMALIPLGWSLGAYLWLGPLPLAQLRGPAFLAATLLPVVFASRHVREKTGALSWPDR